MSDDPTTPFGAIFPGPSEEAPGSPSPVPSANPAPPPPPIPVGASVPPPPIPVEPSDLAGDLGSRGEASPGQTAVAVLEAPNPTAHLGNEWTFGAPSSRGLSLPKPRKPVALALVVVLIAATGAYFFLSRSKSGGGTAFALNLTQGQTYRYHVDVAFNGTGSALGRSQPFSVVDSETFAWEVESVDSSGVATVKMSVEEATETMNGAPVTSPLPQPVEIRVAKDGRVLLAGGSFLSGGSGFGLPGVDQFTPLLPDHPVKPGDTWTKSFDQEFPFGGGRIHYVANSQYLRNETVNGVQAAVISSAIDLPLDLTIDVDKMTQEFGGSTNGLPAGASMQFSGSMNFTQTSWLDLSHGAFLKGSISGNMDMGVEFHGLPAGQDPGKVTFSGTMSIQVQQVSGSGGGTSAPSAADLKAQSELRNALAAAKVYFTDRSSYLGISPSTMHGIEPSLTFSTSPKAKEGKVSIRGVTQRSVVLVTRSGGGQVFCVADSVDAGTVYGTQDAKDLGGCSGGW